MSNKPVSYIILQADGGFYRRKLEAGTALTLQADTITIKDSGGTFVYPRADYVPPQPVPTPTPAPPPLVPAGGVYLSILTRSQAAGLGSNWAYGGNYKDLSALVPYKKAVSLCAGDPRYPVNQPAVWTTHDGNPPSSSGTMEMGRLIEAEHGVPGGVCGMAGMGGDMADHMAGMGVPSGAYRMTMGISGVTPTYLIGAFADGMYSAKQYARQYGLLYQWAKKAWPGLQSMAVAVNTGWFGNNGSHLYGYTRFNRALRGLETPGSKIAVCDSYSWNQYYRSHNTMVSRVQYADDFWRALQAAKNGAQQGPTLRTKATRLDYQIFIPFDLTGGTKLVGLKMVEPSRDDASGWNAPPVYSVPTSRELSSLFAVRLAGQINGRGRKDARDGSQAVAIKLDPVSAVQIDNASKQIILTLNSSSPGNITFLDGTTMPLTKSVGLTANFASDFDLEGAAGWGGGACITIRDDQINPADGIPHGFMLRPEVDIYIAPPTPETQKLGAISAAPAVVGGLITLNDGHAIWSSIDAAPAGTGLWAEKALVSLDGGTTRTTPFNLTVMQDNSLSGHVRAPKTPGTYQLGVYRPGQGDPDSTVTVNIASRADLLAMDGLSPAAAASCMFSYDVDAYSTLWGDKAGTQSLTGADLERINGWDDEISPGAQNRLTPAPTCANGGPSLDWTALKGRHGDLFYCGPAVVFEPGQTLISGAATYLSKLSGDCTLVFSFNKGGPAGGNGPIFMFDGPDGQLGLQVGYYADARIYRGKKSDGTPLTAPVSRPVSSGVLRYTAATGTLDIWYFSPGTTTPFHDTIAGGVGSLSPTSLSVGAGWTNMMFVRGFNSAFAGDDTQGDVATTLSALSKLYTIRKPTVAPAATATQTPTPAPTPAPATSPTTQTGPLSGFTFVQFGPLAMPEMAEGTDTWNVQSAIGRLTPTGGTGPYKFSFGKNNPGYRLRADGSLVNPYSPTPAGGVDSVDLVVTDATGATVSKTVTVDKGGASPCIYPATPTVVSTGGTLKFNLYAFGAAFNDGVTWAAADPAKVWSYDGYGSLQAAAPAPGVYSVQMTATPKAGDAVTKTISITVLAGGISGPIVFIPGPVSTSMLPGSFVGQLAATAPNNSPSFSVSDPQGLLQCTPAGTVTVKVQPGQVGPLAVTATVSEGALTYSQTFTLPVLQGTTLDPAKMTIPNLNQALGNGVRGQHIGDVKVDAIFASRVKYAIVSQTRFNPTAVTAAYGPRITINKDTGSIDAASLLSEGTDTIVVSATDGISTCTRSFDITVARAAKVTSYYVGSGDPKTVGKGVPPEAIKVDFHGARLAHMGAHTDFRQVYLDDGDPDVYASANTKDTDYQTRFAWQGPGLIAWIGTAAGAPEPVAHIGGASSNDQPGGGDMRGKGALVLGDGDWTVIGLKLANTHGSDSTHGLEALRRDGETYGDTTCIGCEVVDNDQGFEAGMAHGVFTVDSCEFTNNGTSHVSSGACHNLYIGNVWKFVMRNSLSRRATLGHLLKSRAMISEITGNRLFDGLTGSSSCCADFPNGGQVTFAGNFVEKGAMAMNPFAIQHGAEGVTYDQNPLVVADNTISILTLGGNHYGQPAAVAVFSGQPGVSATISGNRFFASDKSLAKGRFVVGIQGTTGITEIGTITLTAPPLLDLTRPYFAGPLPPPGPLYMHTLWGQDCFRNFEGVQQIPDREEIVVPRSAKAGTVLCAMAGHSDTAGKAPNKFTAGTSASLVRDGVYYPTILADPWAADGAFTVASDAAGVAQLRLGTDAANLNAPDGVLYVQVRLKAPDGTLCDSRYAIKRGA